MYELVTSDLTLSCANIYATVLFMKEYGIDRN